MDELRDWASTPRMSGRGRGRSAGNLIARIPGRGERWLSFFAHLDTVPHDGPIRVARDDGPSAAPATRSSAPTTRRP